MEKYKFDGATKTKGDFIVSNVKFNPIPKKYLGKFQSADGMIKPRMWNLRGEMVGYEKFETLKLVAPSS